MAHTKMSCVFLFLAVSLSSVNGMLQALQEAAANANSFPLAPSQPNNYGMDSASYGSSNPGYSSVYSSSNPGYSSVYSSSNPGYGSVYSSSNPGYSGTYGTRNIVHGSGYGGVHSGYGSGSSSGYGPMYGQSYSSGSSSGYVPSYEPSFVVPTGFPASFGSTPGNSYGMTGHRSIYYGSSYPGSFGSNYMQKSVYPQQPYYPQQQFGSMCQPCWKYNKYSTYKPTVPVSNSRNADISKAQMEILLRRAPDTPQAENTQDTHVESEAPAEPQAEEHKE